jgi:hypothetical protein
MKSRLMYFLQFIGKAGVWGYLFLAGMAAGFILSVPHAPIPIILAYSGFGLIFWFALFRGFVEAERLNDIGLDGEAEILNARRKWILDSSWRKCSKAGRDHDRSRFRARKSSV